MAQAQRCLYMGDQINHLWKIAHLLWNHCIERMLCVGVLDAMTMTMLTTMMIVLMIMIMIYRSKSSKPATRCWNMLDLLGRHYTFPSICDDVCCTWKIAVFQFHFLPYLYTVSVLSRFMCVILLFARLHVSVSFTFFARMCSWKSKAVELLSRVPNGKPNERLEAWGKDFKPIDTRAWRPVKFVGHFRHHRLWWANTYHPTVVFELIPEKVFQTKLKPGKCSSSGKNAWILRKCPKNLLVHQTLPNL